MAAGAARMAREASRWTPCTIGAWARTICWAACWAPRTPLEMARPASPTMVAGVMVRAVYGFGVADRCWVCCGWNGCVTARWAVLSAVMVCAWNAAPKF